MAVPTATDFIISQGDTIPVMKVHIPRDSAGALVDLAGATVTFLGRIAGTTPGTTIVKRAMQGFEVLADEVVVSVKFEAADTALIPMKDAYLEMSGELEILDGTDVLTIPNDPTTPYLKWFIRDDIGAGA